LTTGRPSIAIVVTFFGQPPLWMPAFLLSCRANPDVHWILYTDIEPPRAFPPNVVFKRMDVPEFDRHASAVLGARIQIPPRRMKKLSDLKPTYGLLFADELRSFDFWAYSELDVVWGNIRQFMTDDLLSCHDIVSARHYKIAGHFTLFRNTPAINRAFEMIPGATEALTSPRYCHLDESAFTSELRKRMERPLAPDFPRVHWQHDLTMSADYQNTLAEGPAGELWWREGKTFDAEGRELMYLHFHRLKVHMREINFGCEDAPTAFAVSRRGVVA